MNQGGHNVTGNGRREGLKTSLERAISNQAPRTGEGSEAIPKGSRNQVIPKRLAGLQSALFYGKILSMKWSKCFDVCVKCGSTENPHMAKGKCRRCYLSEYQLNPKNAERIAAAKKRNYSKVTAEDRKMKREQRHFDGKREAVIKRDGYRCTKCGVGEQLVVHHVDGMGRGSAIPNNSIRNLVTLCRACHARLHGRVAWAKDFSACLSCGKTNYRHNAKGLCVRCYYEANKNTKARRYGPHPDESRGVQVETT